MLDCSFAWSGFSSTLSRAAAATAIASPLALSAAPMPKSSDEAPPNVLIILADDLGYGSAGSYGASDPIVTPNIDRLVGQGVRMTDAHVSSPLCAPSRMGLLTGRYQQRSGVYINPDLSGPGMSPDEVTLAECLKGNGYDTAIVGKWHLGSRPGQHPLDQGFDYFYGFDRHGDDYFEPEYMMHNRQHIDEIPGYRTDVFTNEAIQFIEKERNQPFFLYLPYGSVHAPRQVPVEQVADFDTGNEWNDMWYAQLKRLDLNIGRLLGALEKSGQADNTLVIYLSDNGGARGFPPPNNAPLRGGKRTLWEGGTRVHMAIRWPGHIPMGQTSNALISSLDLFPTILTATGTEQLDDRQLDGQNLLGHLQTQAQLPPKRELFWAARHYDPEVATYLDKKSKKPGWLKAPPVWTVRWGQWKLMTNARTSEQQLYDLSDDIGERVNVIEQYPEVARQMTQAYVEWIAEMRPPRSWDMGNFEMLRTVHAN